MDAILKKLKGKMIPLFRSVKGPETVL